MKKLCLFLLFFAMITSPVLANSQTVLVTDEIYKDMEALKYPQVSETEKPGMEDKINKTFQKYIKESFKELKENEEQSKKYDFHAEYQTDYEVKYNQASKLSILTSNYIFSGGAHGNTTVESFNYDMDKGKRVYLTNILTEEEQIEAVRDYVWEYATERPDIFYPDLKKEDIKLTKDTAFYFTDDGITLVFQQYEIAPYVAGNQEIHVPTEVYE
ncbi:DUF4163 domain-containing protein [Gracilibacillus salitolerans]|uniref:DUF4163 domain-containing protein n=1 Tax=Gracilibacillus salitolerans TaxID=2663022 RepID=A0A5Q2TLQ6_9BACI|nr:DUF3298 and DUF4163 domain-containing protein [Gracilibacillus salitolerans]QGH35595.1 DUF4163 domain-containing protein [Gracilibacillus salitolerans]